VAKVKIFQIDYSLRLKAHNLNSLGFGAQKPRIIDLEYLDLCRTQRRFGRKAPTGRHLKSLGLRA